MHPRTRNTTSTIAGRLAVAALVVLAVLGTTAGAAAHNTPWGQGQSDSRDLTVSLFTFGPGDEIAQWFGHSALSVRDQSYNVFWLYNYGLFSLDGALIPRFAMGRLEFWVGGEPAEPDDNRRGLNAYRASDRDIRRIDLNLSAQRSGRLAEFLADNTRPENRQYLYHHYDDNCSTRVRDAIDMAVDGQFKERYEDEPGRLTLREHTRRHTAHNPPMDWLLMYLMNHDIDEPTTVWGEMFLPGELERRVLEFQYEDDDGELRDLAGGTYHDHRTETRQPPPEKPPTHWPWWLLVGLGIGAIGVVIGLTARRRPGRTRRLGYGAYQLVLGLVMGLPGLMLGLMAAFTEHDVTYWNQNLFWANPLTLGVALLAVFVMWGKRWAREWLVKLWLLLAGVAAVGLVVQLVSLLEWIPYQDTSIPMATLVPIVAGAAAAAWLVDGRTLKEPQNYSGAEGG